MRALVLVQLSILLISFVECVVAYRRVCYFRYRSPLAAQYIDPDICTHINYAFITIKDCNLVPLNPGDEYGYKSLQEFKVAHPKVKILFSIGGGGHPFGFHNAVANEQNRTRFIEQAIQFVHKYQYDGLDFDWEFPTGPDKHFFTIMLQEFRLRIQKHNLTNTFTLSAAVSGSPNNYDVSALSTYLDFVNLMCYDYNSYETHHKTAFNSPLFAETKEVGPDRSRNTNGSVQEWLIHGISSWKLNMGMPTYGRGFTLADINQHGFYDNAVADAGTPIFTEMCRKLALGATRVFDESSKVPYLYYNKTWISYDDEESFIWKANYIKKNKLGGSMTWVLDADDWSGFCLRGNFPLHQVLKRLLPN